MTEPPVVQRRSYVDLLSTVGEINRCPGGKKTIARIIRDLGISERSKVLEIGSNTGFTSFEIAKTAGCRVTGVDINSLAVQEAKKNLEQLPSALRKRVKFSVANACSLPFADQSFDFIICGGANSFVVDRRAAFAEYARVLRTYGKLSITNLFYREAPPQDLLDKLREVLGVDIPVWGVRQWLKELRAPGWELFSAETFDLVARPNWVVDAYVDWFRESDKVRSLPDKESVIAQWRATCHVFNANHRYLSYLQLLLRKPYQGEKEQPELFLEPGVLDPFFEEDFIGHTG